MDGVDKNTYDNEPSEWVYRRIMNDGPDNCL